MMNEWIPIPGTNKDKLIQIALKEFSKKGYKGVNISELAKKANMTTGAIYHHFGSKANMYEVIRIEMEQRILDRMEGVFSVFDKPEEGLKAALIAALKFVVKMDICLLISEASPTNKTDKINDFLTTNGDSTQPVSIILNASWRSILASIAENKITPEQGEELIKWMFT